jgi:hypothetical protein
MAQAASNWPVTFTINLASNDYEDGARFVAQLIVFKRGAASLFLPACDGLPNDAARLITNSKQPSQL